MKEVSLISINRIHLSKDDVVPAGKPFICSDELAKKLTSGARPAARYPERIVEEEEVAGDEFDGMSKNKLKAYADKHGIVIPDGMTAVKDLREHVRAEVAKNANDL